MFPLSMNIINHPVFSAVKQESDSTNLIGMKEVGESCTMLKYVFDT